MKCTLYDVVLFFFLITSIFIQSIFLAMASMLCCPGASLRSRAAEMLGLKAHVV